MVTDESVEKWKRCPDDWEKKWFPQYYVSQPPHRDELTPVYYKVVSPNGPVFWRRKGDTESKTTSFFDLLMESANGYGINSVDKVYTPWSYLFYSTIPFVRVWY